MRVPVRPFVRAWPDVEPCTVRAGELGVGAAERIVTTDVDPERPAVREAPVHDVVTLEVLRVVERTGGRLAAGAPQSGRVRADGAEAVRSEPREIEGAEASHRDARDRDAVRIGVRPTKRGRDDLAQDVGSPAAGAPVVPVARAVVVGND